jgi:DNA-binding CsgD family transcriptional regulator
MIRRRLRGEQPQAHTPRQVDVLAAFVDAGGSVSEAAARVGIRPSTAKRHLADLRARSGLTTEQLIYCGRAEGWLVVPSLEPTLEAVRWPAGQPVERSLSSQQ